MKIICRFRRHHRWLMGGPVSEFFPTQDICLTCRKSTEWDPIGTDGDG